MTLPAHRDPDTVISARVPRSVVKRLRKVARLHDRTISGQLRKILREWREPSPHAHATPDLAQESR